MMLVGVGSDELSGRGGEESGIRIDNVVLCAKIPFLILDSPGDQRHVPKTAKIAQGLREEGIVSSHNFATHQRKAKASVQLR